MPHFLLTFGNVSRPPVGVVIIEAPSMFQARVTAVIRRLAAGVPFGECHELSPKMMTSICEQMPFRDVGPHERARLPYRWCHFGGARASLV
jgi:hypothetical protein